MFDGATADCASVIVDVRLDVGTLGNDHAAAAVIISESSNAILGEIIMVLLLEYWTYTDQYRFLLENKDYDCIIDVAVVFFSFRNDKESFAIYID